MATKQHTQYHDVDVHLQHGKGIKHGHIHPYTLHPERVGQDDALGYTVTTPDGTDHHIVVGWARNMVGTTVYYDLVTRCDCGAPAHPDYSWDREHERRMCLPAQIVLRYTYQEIWQFEDMYILDSTLWQELVEDAEVRAIALAAIGRQ